MPTVSDILSLIKSLSPTEQSQLKTALLEDPPKANNSYHSKLKKFMRIFNGVSTKYLNNYLLWNNWVNVKGGSIRDRVNILLKACISEHIYIKCKTLSNQPTVPLLG